MSSLPLLPGVYWFLDQNGKVIYVGKAKKLKNRVRSYTRFNQLSNKIKQMVTQAVTVKFKVLDNELQALLIEAELIRTYQPEHNTLLKDDKSPLYIQITNDKYPRVLKIRKKTLIKNQSGWTGKVQTNNTQINNNNKNKRSPATILGPFPNANKVTEVLKIARKIFPWCNQTSRLRNQNSSWENKKIPSEKNLTIESKATTHSLNKNKTTENSSSKNGQNPNTQPCFYYHIDQCPGACIEKISPDEYKKNIDDLILFLKGKKKTVTKSLKNKMAIAIKKQNYEEAAVIRDQLKIIKEVTSNKHKLKPELTNAGLQAKISEDGIIYLQKILSEYLGLPKQLPLTRIEGYDVSNTQGTNPAVSMVTFIDGKSDTSKYRVFNIKTLDTPNDYYMLQEAVTRRQNHPEWGTPNLILVDGGKGQVRAVLKIWQWYCPVIGIAKNPDRLVLPYRVENEVENSKSTVSNTSNATDSLNKNPVKNSKKIKIKYHMIKLNPTHPTLKLIQQIRDESHRFAQRQHKKKRLEGMFE